MVLKRALIKHRATDIHIIKMISPGAEFAFDDPEIPQLIIPDGRGIPSVYGDHVNLMLDIMTLAFQTDTTRIASFMFSYEKSGRAYPQIDAKGSHHSTSHHKSEERTCGS